MVKTISTDGSSLVPALLACLKHYPNESSNKHLALQVLNNPSLPLKNKAFITLECNGSNILVKLLGKESYYEILVIIILNLTFCDEQYLFVRASFSESTLASI